MGCFASKTGWKKRQRAKMSENLTKSQVDLLTAEFHEADLDKTGYLTTYELKNAILKKGKALSGEVIEAMIQDADKDGDGKVNLEEFLNAFADAQSKETKDPTKEAKSPDKEGKNSEW